MRFLDRLTPAGREHLATLGSTHTLAAGEVLARAGEMGDLLYLVLDGQIEVVDSSAGVEVVLARIGPGEVAGAAGFLALGPRSEDLRAAGSSTVRAISPIDVAPSAAFSATFHRSLAATLADQLRATSSTMMIAGGGGTAGPVRSGEDPREDLGRMARAGWGEADTRLRPARSRRGPLASGGRPRQLGRWRPRGGRAPGGHSGPLPRAPPLPGAVSDRGAGRPERGRNG